MSLIVATEKKRKKAGGRKKGTPNRLTQKMRDYIAKIVEGIDIQSEIKSLTPLERVKLWTSLIEYIVPKLEREPLPPQIDEDTVNEHEMGKFFDEIDNTLKSNDSQNDTSRQSCS